MSVLVNKLISHIEYLLLSHDCVIVPGLGAILAHTAAPYYDDEKECWIAPKRVLSFNAALSRTDGLLASSIARRECITIDSASAVVRREADAMRYILDTERVLQIGSIGSLEMDDEGLLSFTPGNAQWLSPACLWLPDVYIRPQKPASEIARVQERLERRRELPYILRRCGQVAAGVAAFIALGWVVVQNISYAPTEQFASIAPNIVSTAATRPSAEKSPVVLVLSQAPKDEVIENIPQQNIVKNTESEVAGKYFLIVASLSSKAEAEEYIKQNPDSNLGILSKDGRYRIYAVSGNTIEEVTAASKTPEIASRYPNSWVCRR